jgi:urate oxidase
MNQDEPFPRGGVFLYTSEETPFYEMTIRVLRFKDPNGNHRMIFTNLNDEFSYNEIDELYTSRWGIETAFRELKHILGLTAFHSKKTASIHQEIFARLTIYNFCEMIIGQIIVKQKNGKHDYQVNFTVAIDICRKFFSTQKYKRPPDIEALILKNILKQF